MNISTRLRRISMILVVGTVLTACGAGAGSATPSLGESPAASVMPSASAAPSQPTHSEVAVPSDEPSPSPASGAAVHLDTVVETVVEELTVRREPGTSGERIGVLPIATLAFVLAGPMEMDGFPWYRITGMGLPYASGCPTTPPDVPISCPAFQGWVAGTSEAGEPWIATASLDACADPDLRTISDTGFTWRLYCWADEPITFEAWWPQIPEDAGLGGVCPESGHPSGFLYCQNINYNGLAASAQEGFVTRLNLSIDPASGLTMPERGQRIRVTGTFDHPAAAGCAELANQEWEDSYGAVFRCRIEFVPTAIEALGS